MVPNLACETVDSIIDRLAEETRSPTESLKNASLVHSTWRPRAQAHLFSHLHLDEEKLSNFLKLVAAPEADSHSLLSGVIQTIRVVNPMNDSGHLPDDEKRGVEECSDDQDEVLSPLLPSVAPFSSTHSLTVDCLYSYDDSSHHADYDYEGDEDKEDSQPSTYSLHPQTLQLAKRLTHITSLTFLSVNGYNKNIQGLAKFISSFPIIQYLTIEEHTEVSPEDVTSTLVPVSLKGLGLRGCELQTYSECIIQASTEGLALDILQLADIPPRSTFLTIVGQCLAPMGMYLQHLWLEFQSDTFDDNMTGLTDGLSQLVNLRTLQIYQPYMLSLLPVIIACLTHLGSSTAMQEIAFSQPFFLKLDPHGSDSGDSAFVRDQLLAIDALIASKFTHLHTLIVQLILPDPIPGLSLAIQRQRNLVFRTEAIRECFPSVKENPRLELHIPFNAAVPQPFDRPLASMRDSLAGALWDRNAPAE